MMAINKQETHEVNEEGQMDRIDQKINALDEGMAANDSVLTFTALKMLTRSKHNRAVHVEDNDGTLFDEYSRQCRVGCIECPLQHIQQSITQ